MRQEYVVEPTADGRLQLRIVLVPYESDYVHPEEESAGRVIIIEPDQDDSGVIIIENM